MTRASTAFALAAALPALLFACLPNDDEDNGSRKSTIVAATAAGAAGAAGASAGASGAAQGGGPGAAGNQGGAAGVGATAGVGGATNQTSLPGAVPTGAGGEGFCYITEAGTCPDGAEEFGTKISNENGCDGPNLRGCKMPPGGTGAVYCAFHIPSGHFYGFNHSVCLTYPDWRWCTDSEFGDLLQGKIPGATEACPPISD